MKKGNKEFEDGQGWYGENKKVGDVAYVLNKLAPKGLVVCTLEQYIKENEKRSV